MMLMNFRTIHILPILSRIRRDMALNLRLNVFFILWIHADQSINDVLLIRQYCCHDGKSKEHEGNAYERTNEK